MQNTFINIHNKLEWVVYDVTSDEDANTIADFLSDYYIENTKSKTRIQYTSKYIQWLFHFSTCIGIRFKYNKVPVGFISGRLQKTQVFSSVYDMLELEFLCVKTEMRKKNTASILRKQITHMFKAQGYDNVMCCTGSPYSKLTPLYESKMYYRPLNPKKLLRSGIIELEK